MVPLISARIEASFGRRASNRSATRGRPPVMSRVLEVSCGIRAITSPTPTCAPSATPTRALAGRKYWAGTSTWQQQVITIHTHHLHSRANIFAGGWTVFGIQNFNVGQTGQFVSLTLDRDAFFHAHVGHGTFHFGNDRVGVRVPLSDDGTSVNLVAFLHGNHGTVRQLVTLALTTEVVGDGQLTRAGNRYQVAVQALYVLQVVQANSTAVFNLNTVSCRGPACRTTDVEGTHGQLGARLTNRLGRDHTNGFADVDLVTTSQVATVALGANAVAGFAADRRTHDHFVDAVQLDEFNPLLVNQGTGRNLG